MSKTYTIKPLEWTGRDPVNTGTDAEPWWEGSWTASTVFGSYTIEKNYDGGSIHWGYCFDEYYDEEQHDCDSVEEGKAAAEAHYLSRILPALSPTHPKEKKSE